jgi:hypothetical protein
MPPPVKLYAPSRYREPGISNHIELLFPFWGVVAKESMPYIKDALTKYQYSKKDFTLVERIEDTDYVVIPYHYERLRGVNPKRLSLIIEEAERARKPLLIDGSGDVEHPIDIPRSVILRLSQYHYSRKANEITVPFPAEDLLESYAGGTLTPREKHARPSVAFAGWASPSLKQRLSDLVFGGRGPERKGIFFRERALTSLTRSKQIDAHLLARTSYSGHVKTMAGPVADIRREFVENLMGADYALAIRGDANSSVRFYEALSASRIPLFLDTACVLPLEDKLNYRDFCLFVDWRDVDKIGEVLADFHQSISPERFIDMQKKAREAFTKYLRYDAFSPHLATKLHEHLPL